MIFRFDCCYLLRATALSKGYLHIMPLYLVCEALQKVTLELLDSTQYPLRSQRGGGAAILLLYTAAGPGLN